MNPLGPIQTSNVCATLSLSLSLQATFVFSLVCWSPLSLGKGIVAPGWATALGWLLTLSSVSLLPLCALYALATTPGSLTQVSHTFVHQQPTTTLGPTITLTPTLTVTLTPTVQHCTMWTDSTLNYRHFPCDLPSWLHKTLVCLENNLYLPIML